MHSGFMALEQLCPWHSTQTGEQLSLFRLQVHLEVWQLVFAVASEDFDEFLCSS